MIQWEYQTVRFQTGPTAFSGNPFKTTTMNEELNALGADGWELITVFELETWKGGSRFVIAIFKRPKQN
jgi:hypothetical protein